jgi:hypothetical protein
MIDAQIQNDSTQSTTMSSTPAVITVSGVIKDLENGLDRGKIAEKYNLTAAEIRIMFQHPSLKGKRVRKNKLTTLRFQLIDDTVEQMEAVDPNQTNILDAIEEVEQKDFNTEFN